MSIKLITFDLDDTLWDTAPVIASAEVVLRDWLEANAPLLGGVPVEQRLAEGWGGGALGFVRLMADPFRNLLLQARIALG